MRGARLLVVDDEPAVLLTYTLILQQNGYEVTAAASIEEAKAALQQQTFDVTVCDLTLEIARGGFEVLEFARAQNPSGARVLLTGYDTPEVVSEAARKGLTLMFKPVDIQALLRAVADLSSRRSA